MTPDDLRRALGYPYPAPRPPWIYRDGHIISPSDEAFEHSRRDISHGDRIPVVAAGSNRAPEQLRRKFGDDALFPVSTVRLRDVETVYSAHFASYGSVPATLVRSPGTELDTAVLWLTDDQLEQMNRTEALGLNYRLGWIERKTRSARFGLTADSMAGYLSLHGAVTDEDGIPVPVAGFRRRGSKGIPLDQAGVSSLCRNRLAPDHDEAGFIRTLIADAVRRTEWRDGLKALSMAADAAFWPSR